MTDQTEVWDWMAVELAIVFQSQQPPEPVVSTSS